VKCIHILIQDCYCVSITVICVLLLENLEYLSDILLSQFMGTLVTSKREVKYTLWNDMSVVQSVMAEEVHNMLVEM
jgi:hypothetical protein